MQQLPPEDADWAFSSCAVVGNSGRLLNAKQGADIDAHQVVIRINLAPVEGWEEYVGSRTTFNMANHFHVSKLAWPGKSLKGHDAKEVRRGQDALKSHRKNTKETLLLFEATQYRAYYRLWEPLLRHVPATRVAILSPDFVTAASEMWWILLDQLQQEGSSAGIVRRKDGTCARHKDGSFSHSAPENLTATCARPLSGWFALAFSARVCEKVDVYGFNYYKRLTTGLPETKEDNVSYHYYDDVQGETGTHNFDMTMKVLEKLGSSLNLVIH